MKVKLTRDHPKLGARGLVLTVPPHYATILKRRGLAELAPAPRARKKLATAAERRATKAKIDPERAEVVDLPLSDSELKTKLKDLSVKVPKKAERADLIALYRKATTRPPAGLG